MAIHEHDDYVSTHVHDTVERVSTYRSPFGVAQAVCLLGGILFVVLGAVGLARAGLDHATTHVGVVGGFRMTGLLAIASLVIGLICLGGSSTRLGARSVGMVLGPLLIALGIVAIIQPVRALGWNDAYGFLSLFVGIALLIGAMMTPPAVVGTSNVTGTRV